MVVTKRITIPYRPRKAFQSFHQRTQRWSSMVVHRRGGKTVASINELQKAALSNQRTWPPPKYAYIAPFYNQAKRIAWGYAKHYADPVPGRLFNESELKITYPTGAELRLFGADNPDALRGDYLDGVVPDEYGDWAPSVWPLVVRPMLSDFQGWAAFIGTPKGRNGFYDLHKAAEKDPANWFTMTLRASESGIILPDEIADLRRGMSAEQFAQEFECDFDAAVVGAYFGQEIAEARRMGRICDVQYEPSLPVHTAWDLGIGDSTAIWFFQVSRAEIRVIDHYENHGQALPHYASVLASKPYKYGDDYVPHDARVRELGTGRTRIEVLEQLGRKPKLVPAHKLGDGIEAARLTLAACWFDAHRCADGIDALSQYQKDYDEKKRDFRDTPRHDWTSHSSDSFRYLAMAWREMGGAPVRKPADRFLNVGFSGGATFDDLVTPLAKIRPREDRI